MSGDMRVCDLDPDLKKLLTDFRFKKNNSGNSAIIMKVDRETHRIVLDEDIDDLESISTLVEDHLPSHQPRFLVLSIKVHHSTTNRVSFPLCFIFISPRDCNPELQMMYAGSKLALQKELDITKVFEVRELEELTEEWLMCKLDNERIFEKDKVREEQPTHLLSSRTTRSRSKKSPTSKSDSERNQSSRRRKEKLKTVNPTSTDANVNFHKDVLSSTSYLLDEDGEADFREYVIEKQDVKLMPLLRLPLVIVVFVVISWSFSYLSTQLGILTGFIIVLGTWFNMWNTVVQETLIASRHLGVQILQTNILGVTSNAKYVPKDNIKAIVINEIIRRQRVISYLLVILESTESTGKIMVPLLIGTLPRLRTIEKIYKQIRQVLMFNKK